MNKDLKLIKKHYGEKMMHLCRELFPTLLEQEGLLSKLMLDTFAPSRFLYDDIVESNNIEEFKNYIYEIVDLKRQDELKTNKTPKELLSEAGYDLYECKTEDEIQKFKKYYAPGEELCTFNGGRLNRCHVFFAIKKNVDEIKRENFKTPERQDEYGTSVISIQFSRGNINTLSIKNRYNHRVSNPDATFSNNLENIIEGLTNSFEKEYNLNINQNEYKNFDLPDYVKANDGKFYKYNYEINNIYYCPDNIIIDNFEVKQYPKERYIILDYFIIDLVNKKIELYDNELKDCFIDGFKNIDKINIINHKETGNKKIEIIIPNKDKIIIIVDKANRIIEYRNSNLRKVGNNFLRFNEELKYIGLPNLVSVGHHFLHCNKSLEELELPKLLKLGDDFLYCNCNLKNFKFPLLMQIGNNFLPFNKELLEIELPNLIEVENNFLWYNENLKKLIAPKLQKIGYGFLWYNIALEELFLPNVTRIGDSFLYQNEKLLNLDLPKLLKLGHSCLFHNIKMNYLNLPEVIEIGDAFLCQNKCLTKIKFPKFKKHY